MSFDLAGLGEALAVHGKVARVVIADHKGSSPREAGASMLVWQDGQSGSIGGGALELEAARQARCAAKTQVARVPLGPALGQCCGGAVTLVTEVFTEMPDAGPVYIRRVEGAAEHGFSTQNGSGGLVFENGWLTEPVQAVAAPLWVWGAGHVGRAIVSATAPLGLFEMTWIDSDMGRFPDLPRGVSALPAAHIPDAVRLAPPKAHHVILTYSHAYDLEICHRLLGRGFASAGLIGSATKWARFKARLGALGHSSVEISRICCPIGRPELGKHPQAIAVGVASELIVTLQSEGQRGQAGKEVAV